MIFLMFVSAFFSIISGAFLKEFSRFWRRSGRVSERQNSFIPHCIGGIYIKIQLLGERRAVTRSSKSDKNTNIKLFI